VSLKGPPLATPDEAVHRRPEVEGPATLEPDPDTWPASEARDALESLRGGRRLREILRLEQRRTERAVTMDGRRVGLLSLDEVTFTGAPEPVALLHAVELEMDPTAGDGGALGALVTALRAIDGLVVDPRSKLEHAFDRRARR
jgi:inorganic triphosphatase YgiF